MSETKNNSCVSVKHNYTRYNDVIYCHGCGDIKSLILPIPTTTTTKTTSRPFESAKKYFFKHGHFTKNAVERSKATLEKLFLSVSNEKHIQLNEVNWKNMEEYAMFVAIILVTKEGGYSIEVSPTPSYFIQRVEFHLKCFNQSPKLEWSGMKFDQNENRLVVLTKGENTLLIHPDIPIKKTEQEETPSSRFNRARDFLIEKKNINIIEWSVIMDVSDVGHDVVFTTEESLKTSPIATRILIIVVALRMVSRQKETKIIFPNCQLVQEFVDKVFSYLEFFKETEEFGWTRETESEKHDIFAIKITKTGEIGSFVIKYQSLERFDDALAYYAPRAGFGFGLMAADVNISKVREALKEDTPENLLIDSHYPGIIALLMVSQSLDNYVIKVTTRSEAMDLSRLVQKELDVFKDSPQFTWTKSERVGEGVFIDIKMTKDLQYRNLTIEYHSFAQKEKIDVPDIVNGLSQIYENQRKAVADENEKEMHAILKLCQDKLKPGEYLELPEKEYPRLEKEPFMFEHFLRRNGYWLSSKAMGYHFMVTMPHFLCFIIY